MSQLFVKAICVRTAMLYDSADLLSFNTY